MGYLLDLGISRAGVRNEGLVELRRLQQMQGDEDSAEPPQFTEQRETRG